MENQDIAIVGMSVYCPAGESVDEFWQGISRGGDFIIDAPEDVIEDFYFDGAPNGVDKFYCRRGGFCKPFKVDPIRYGVMPIAADGTDPDHLASMAGAEQALIDAEIFQKGIPLQKCSIIIGKGNFSGRVHLRSLELIRVAPQITALLKSALPGLTDEDLEKVRKAYQSRQGRYQPDMATGTMPNLVASLVANRFDMHGPAYTIDAACASGIVAINHSISLLRSGQCDVALAGGMHSAQSAMFWGAFDLLGAISHKQVIAPFSEEADGLLIGQGGGFIVLKTLRKALEDGDRIYSVIKETAVCSDGASSHVMVTSVSGQTRVLEQAWKTAGMDPERIGFIEAHGTGTIVGDRTEIVTLKDFFGDKSHPCAYVGSIKSNIGHTMPAAGIIGVIKTALALYHRKIPPTLHCERPLSAMFESRFLPPRELVDWDGERLPLVAGVNAFGFGGINAHAILTAYEPEAGKPWKRPKPYLGEALMASAVSGAALTEKLENGDYTNTGGNYRLVIFDPDQARIRQAIAIVKKDKPWRGKEDIWFTNMPMLSDNGKIVFLFPGFGNVWDSDTDRLSEILDLPYINELNVGMDDETPIFKIMMHAHYSEWICKKGLEKIGVEADIYAGHSVGEWAASIFSGLVGGNADEMTKNLSNLWAIKKHSMITINGVGSQRAEAWCNKIPDLWLACDNCPNQVMICGREASVEALVKILDEERVYYAIMPFASGWHTPMAAEEIHIDGELFKNVNIQKGRVPVWSATTLEQVPEDKDHYIKYIYEHEIKPVYFRELIEKLYNEHQARVFIQIGFGSLTYFVEDTLKGKEFGAISTNVKTRDCADQLRRVMALLFIEGRQADAAFIGVKPIYRVDHSLLMLPRGAPPLLKELPELNEAIRERYGAEGQAMRMPSGAPRYANPIAAAVDGNIRDAITVQHELNRIFERRMSEFGVAAPVSSIHNEKARIEGYEKVRMKEYENAHKGGNDNARIKGGNRGNDFSARGKFEEIIRLSLAEHPYLIDHSIVHQPKGWPFPEDSHTVVPLTMSIELLAEAAIKHSPGKKLVKIGNVSASKWIEMDKPFEAVIQGEWIDPNALKLKIGEYVQAEFTFGDNWPEPPAEYLGEIDIGGKIMECCPARELYDRYGFHGPQYHSCIEMTKINERGMRCQVKKQAGKGSLLDIMGQQLGLFLHLTQSKNTISFPVRLKELLFYSDISDQDGIFDHTMIVKRLTDNVAVGDMALNRNGKLWCVARDFICQRFDNDIPVWNAIRKPQLSKLSQEIAPGVYFYSNNSPDSIMILLGRRYLSGPDREISESLKLPKLRREHLISRIVLKDAVRMFIGEDNGELLFPIEFYCDHDKHGRPVLHGYGRAAEKVDNLYVSLAHKGKTAAAIVSERPVGIDLELIEEKPDDFVKMAYTAKEIGLIKEIGCMDTAIRFWVAKEACAKMMGIGLQGDPKRYEISSVNGDVLIIGGSRVQTAKVGTEYIVGWTV